MVELKVIERQGHEPMSIKENTLDDCIAVLLAKGMINIRNILRKGDAQKRVL